MTLIDTFPTLKPEVCLPERCLQWLCWIAAFALLAPGAAFGQGFMVKPMTIELYPRAGQTVERRLELRNTTADHDITLSVKAMLLSQGEEGAWQVFPPEEAGDFPEADPTSCMPWLRLSEDTVRVPALTVETVHVRFAVPRGAQGFYGAALIVQSVPNPDREPVRGVATVDLVIRFLIPVLVQVQGPFARKRVELLDTDMQLVEAPASNFSDRPKKARTSTKALLTVGNSGQTLARVGGRMTIFRQSGDHWARVTEAKFRERRMIAGARFAMGQDIYRALPSGKYRLDAVLTIDGRAQLPVRKEIDFAGDPDVSTVAADVPFTVEPSLIEVRGLPGAVRNAVITLRNPAEEAIEITCAVGQPKTLQSVALGDIKGDDFSGHGWITVKPEQFSLRGGTERKIRVNVAYPREGTEKPCYYAALDITAAYPDGQNAGTAEALVTALNQKQEPTPVLQGTAMSLAREEGDRYALVASFGNIGDIHVDPSCAGRLTDPTTIKTVKRFELSRESGPLLPLSTARFNGLVDFAGVDPGTYIIEAVAEFAGQTEVQTLPIRVADKAGHKLVEVIRTKTQ